MANNESSALGFLPLIVAGGLFMATSYPLLMKLKGENYDTKLLALSVAGGAGSYYLGSTKGGYWWIPLALWQLLYSTFFS